MSELRVAPPLTPAQPRRTIAAAVSDVAQGTFPTWATFYKWRSLSLIRRTSVAIAQARERLCVLLVGRAQGDHRRENARLETAAPSLWTIGVSRLQSGQKLGTRTLRWYVCRKGGTENRLECRTPKSYANCRGQSDALSTG